jgi:hypothetical protein
MISSGSTEKNTALNLEPSQSLRRGMLALRSTNTNKEKRERSKSVIKWR